jgi:hypothetical protein
MQRLEVSSVVRPIYWSLGVKGLIIATDLEDYGICYILWNIRVNFQHVFIISRKILWDLWRPFLKAIRFVYIRRFMLQLSLSVYLQCPLSCCWGKLSSIFSVAPCVWTPHNFCCVSYFSKVTFPHRCGVILYCKYEQ